MMSHTKVPPWCYIQGRVELNQNVRTICYAHPTYDYVGEEGVVAGWGKQTPGSENTPGTTLGKKTRVRWTPFLIPLEEYFWIL